MNSIALFIKKFNGELSVKFTNGAYVACLKNPDGSVMKLKHDITWVTGSTYLEALDLLEKVCEADLNEVESILSKTKRAIVADITKKIRQAETPLAKSELKKLLIQIQNYVQG